MPRAWWAIKPKIRGGGVASAAPECQLPHQIPSYNAPTFAGNSIASCPILGCRAATLAAGSKDCFPNSDRIDWLDYSAAQIIVTTPLGVGLRFVYRYNNKMQAENMKVLITGGFGFLGRCIAREVSSLGFQVVAPRSAQFNLQTGKGVDDLFEREMPAVVVHSAAYYGGIGFCIANQMQAALINLRMAATIFEASVRHRVQRFVSVGSACGYPGDLDGDLFEKDFFSGRCHETVESYGYSKRVQLVLLKAASNQHGINGVQLALANLYGEHDVFTPERSHAIAALIKKVVEAKLNNTTVDAWGTGAPIRQFLYVGDAAKVIAQAVIGFAGEGCAELINVGGTAISIRDLTHKIAAIVGLPEKSIVWDATKPDGAMRKVLNNDRLHSLLPNYAPQPLDDGLARTVEWYMENKDEADRRK